MAEWREIALVDVANLAWGDTSVTKASYTSTGYTAYSASGPDGFLPYCDHEQAAVVISAIGAKCGKTWLARGRWSCIKNTMWMRARPGIADTAFLYYSTRRANFWPRRGAAQPFISLGDARTTKVALPNLTTQRRIGATLAAFDELIAINERRTELLEDLARSLYREWFVRFRYPGHEGTELVENSGELLPVSWSRVPLGDVAVFVGGSTTTKTQYVDSGYLAFSAAGPDGCLPTYDFEGPGVVLSAVGARCGRTFRAAGRWSTIANTIRYTPKLGAESAAWLFLATANPGIWPRRGSAQPFISINDARRVRVIVPDGATLKRFERICRVWFDQIDGLRSMSDALARARDLLLPRLVTGRLDISNIDLGALLPADAA